MTETSGIAATRVETEPAGRQASTRPILLLSDYSPDMGGGGAVILQSLLTPTDRERIVWLTLAPPRLRDQPPNVKTIRLQSGSLGRSQGVSHSTFQDAAIHARALADEVTRIAREANAAGIWIVMHGASVAIAARLAKRAEFPLHLTVHDDPAYAVALRSRRFLALTPLLAAQLAYALKRAGSIDVIGPGMAERYRKRYGVESVIVHRGLEGTIQPAPGFDRSERALSIGVIGNLYHFRQLPILARALELAANRSGARPRLVMIGMKRNAERLAHKVLGKVEIDARDHLAETDAIALLSRCFVTYLNYPFGVRDRVLRQTSFPTKLSTYLQSARPILIHAPEDSSTMILRGHAPYIETWTDLDPQRGADVLARMFENPELDQSFDATAESLRKEWFDPETNRRRLFAMLDRLGTA